MLSSQPALCAAAASLAAAPLAAAPLAAASLARLDTKDERMTPRTSTLLRDILRNNPGVKSFTVERILASLGTARFGASLLLFSIPAIVPVSSSNGVSALPAGAIGYQLASGQKEIALPRFVRTKSVSRRALAVAIHAALPVLEAAEKLARPRWTWATSSLSRRAIGLFVFLLATAIAFPLIGFSPLHATSIFVMALGLAEQDGLAVLVGAAVGVLSLVLLAASGMSAKALSAKAGRWLQKLGRKLGLRVFAAFLERKGFPRLARLLTFEWSELLLAWNPERSNRLQRRERPGARMSSLARSASASLEASKSRALA
jgi:hypothetical protein